MAPPFVQILKQYHNGNAVLAIVIVLSIVASALCFSMAKATQVTMNGTSSNQIAMQAQQFANSKADLIRTQAYEKISSQAKTKISNSDDFYDQVDISEEVPCPTDSNISQRECTISVYKSNEKFPRATVHFMKYSTASSELDIGEAEYLGSGARSGVAQTAGFIMAGGSDRGTPLCVYVNNKLLGYVTNRDYGTGSISVCVPVPKGATWRITGVCYWAYWSKLKA